MLGLSVDGRNSAVKRILGLTCVDILDVESLATPDYRVNFSGLGAAVEHGAKCIRLLASPEPIDLVRDVVRANRK